MSSNRIIYRGYEIDGASVYECKGEKPVHIASSHDAALSWVDTKRREENRAKRENQN